MSFRFPIPVLPGLLLLPLVAACNAEDPVKPDTFRAAEVDGVWKLTARGESCVPENLRFEFSVNNQSSEPGYLRIGGNWFVVTDPPDPQVLTGKVHMQSAEVELTLTRHITMSGIFLSTDEMATSYRDEQTGCIGRYRGLKVE